MARSNQALADDQPDMFGTAPAPAWQPNPEKVRARLQKLLDEARSDAAAAWEPSTLSLYRTIFPQMAHLLPGDEGHKLLKDFEAAIARLMPLDSAS